MAGVGQHIKIALANLRIQTTADEKGCRCDRIARLMDAMGPDQCEKEIMRLVKLMKKSIRRWRRTRGVLLGAVMHPPNAIIYEFIMWAIDQARKDERRAREIKDHRSPKARRTVSP